MKIVMRDGRVFQGTALQIVKAMQDIAFGVEEPTVPKDIEWVVANARQFEEVELDVKGETDEELAASLVAEMLRTGKSPTSFEQIEMPVKLLNAIKDSYETKRTVIL